MPEKIARSPKWFEDVLNTYEHIALDSVTTADMYLDAIEELLGTILKYPDLGEAVQFADSKLEGLRVIQLSSKFRKHLVFYIPRKRSIHVLRILHRSRDTDSLFSEE